MDPLDRLIKCEYEDCQAQFEDPVKFEAHLKLKHKTNLGAYKKLYPGARTEVLPLDARSLLETVIETEKKVDVHRTADESALPKIDLSKIKDVDYIVAGLKDHFPEKHEFFVKNRQEYLDVGMPKCGALDTLCFLNLLLRDELIAIMEHPDSKGRFSTSREQIEVLKRFTETHETHLKSLKSIYEQTQKEQTVAQMLEQMLDDAETHCRRNVGDIAFKCEQCGAMIDSSGYNHWAYEILKEASGKKIYLLWNPELWELINGIRTADVYGKERHWQIPVWMMAFILGTSVEGLMFTAQHRKMKVERFDRDGRQWATIDGFEFDIGFEEEQSRAALDLFKRTHHEKTEKNKGVSNEYSTSGSEEFS